MKKQTTGFELVISSALQPLIDIMLEVIEQTNFVLEPQRWVREMRDHKKFKLFLKDLERKTRHACGLVEFIATGHNETIIRLEPIPGQYIDNEAEINDLSRLFYLFTQRLVQLQIVTAEPG